jgi:hypothetical protein
MLEDFTEEEADTFLQENPTLVLLYEIDVIKEVEPYQLTEEAAIVELGRAREALERELAVLQRVRPTERGAEFSHGGGTAKRANRKGT